LAFADWQKVLAVQMLLGRYLRAIAEPDSLQSCPLPICGSARHTATFSPPHQMVAGAWATGRRMLQLLLVCLRRSAIARAGARRGCMMKRTAALLLLLLAGCSPAPVADLLDFFRPGRLEPEGTAPYGGVGTLQPVGPPPAGAVVPPPPVFPGA